MIRKRKQILTHRNLDVSTRVMEASSWELRCVVWASIASSKKIYGMKPAFENETNHKKKTKNYKL